MKPLHSIVAISLLMLSSTSDAAETLPLSIQPLPAEMTNRQQALTRYLQPSARAWIDQEASRLTKTKIVDQEGLRSAIRARFKPNQPTFIRKANSPTNSDKQGSLTLNDSDIEMVAFIVLMQATSDMDRDLRDLMAEIKNLTAAKQKLRDLISKVNSDVVAHVGKADIQPCTSPVCEHYPSMSYEAATALKQVPNGGNLRTGAIITVGDLRATLKSLTDNLDSMNEISELTSLRLQMLMDRRSKLISTLSNIMKSISTTKDTVVGNLK
jgi:hypothetical protein